mgnify:FL=1
MQTKETLEQKKRIVLSVTNDLVTDQRVHRACMALMEAGYEVALIGRQFRTSKPVHRSYRTVRMRLLFNKKAVFYAEYNIRLFLKLIAVRCDLFYANDTDTLLANYCAARLRRKPLLFDSHELFPDTPELVGRERVKHVWQRIERAIIPRLHNCITVCHSCAEVLRQRYGVAFGVVRNVPVASPLKAAPHEEGTPYRLLYQGAVNLGRGLEEILDAMPLLDNCQLMVAGVGDHYEQLIEKVKRMGLEDRVEFLGQLPLERLREVTLQAHLGLAILQDLGLNYRCALPNRIGDYAQCGVPVLATDFAEPRRVIEEFGIGALLPSGAEKDPQQLADAIRTTLAEWDAISPDNRQQRFERAGEELCWEHDKKVLIEMVGKALG